VSFESHSRRHVGPPATVPAFLARGARGAATSPHHLASAAGLGVLRTGGSAVDAAIATNAALAVVCSYLCGLGGDAFWLIHDAATGTTHALNGSGRSAASATIGAAHDAGLAEMPVRGPWTITVPGAVDSWGEAHRRFGALPWAKLFEPAIELASDGFPASTAWVETIERAATIYGTSSDWAAVFRPNGRPWREGERVRLIQLGRSLRLIAVEGAGVAYTGALATASAAHLERVGSPLRAADFAAHGSDWVDPITTTYRGVTSLSHPPNSCGPIALLTLNVLGRFTPPAAERFNGDGVDDTAWVHAALEASRMALDERDRVLTDADAMADGALDHLLSDELAASIASRIDTTRVLPPVQTTLPPGGGTIYLATADGKGNAVSLIESNYAGFGSGIVDSATGISFQNRGAFFRLDPTHANALAPRKRTVHTLTPGMLLRDGKPWIVHGSMGGEIQPQVFAQFVSAVVDGGLDVATAVAAPRWAADVDVHLGAPTRTAIESRYHADVIEGLEALGHQVVVDEPWSSGMGHEHAIEIVRDGDGSITFAATADPRSEGLPATW
jgi:gamma-glutamyltranspeptidase/glutathione hydrolase